MSLLAMNSLASRLLLAASLVLVAFFVLTGLAIDQAYRRSADEALRDRLEATTYTLIAATSQPGPDRGPRLDNPLPLPALFTPGARQYGELDRRDGRLVWLSPSAAGHRLPVAHDLGRTETRFAIRDWGAGRRLAVFSVGVAWADSAPIYVFSVAEDLAGHEAAIAGFRRLLWAWLGAAALGLLLAQFVVLRWGLSPLRRIARDLGQIETGRRDRLEGGYPKELRPLTDGLNRLLESERERRRRYRDALGDLAHSLKTPLALMRARLDEGRDPSLRAGLEEQIERISEIVAYRLQRAGGVGRHALDAPVAVEGVVAGVVAALDKVHADKAVDCRVESVGEVLYAADAGDLMELFGNLLDNAYRWSRGRVRIRLEPLAEADTGEGGRAGLQIVVEDDGPGIPESEAERILERGVTREGTGGHGIGLAVVRDIVDLYDGRIAIGRGRWGGLAVTICLPAPS